MLRIPWPSATCLVQDPSWALPCGMSSLLDVIYLIGVTNCATMHFVTSDETYHALRLRAAVPVRHTVRADSDFGVSVERCRLSKWSPDPI